MDLDRLFAAPLKTFVAERKLLVQNLRASGRAKEAKEIQAIPRPSVAAWTVNQLARQDASLVRRLVEITGRLQRAQRQLGAERIEDYAEVLAAHRGALIQIRGRAEEILAISGQIVRPQILEHVIRNLRVGVASEETRREIETGRLVHDLPEGDFVSLLGQSAESRELPEAAESRRADIGASGKQIERVAQNRLAQREQEKADREAAARVAAETESVRVAVERRIRVLRGKAEGAQKMLERAEREVVKAREALAEAEDGLRQARLESELAVEDLRRERTSNQAISGDLRG